MEKIEVECLDKGPVNIAVVVNGPKDPEFAALGQHGVVLKGVGGAPMVYDLNAAGIGPVPAYLVDSQ